MIFVFLCLLTFLFFASSSGWLVVVILLGIVRFIRRVWRWIPFLASGFFLVDMSLLAFNETFLTRVGPNQMVLLIHASTT